MFNYFYLHIINCVVSNIPLNWFYLKLN